MKSVVSGSRSLVFSATSVGSMLETNRAFSPGFTYGWRASYTITGPRSVSTDPDVHYRGHRFAGDAHPFAAAYLVGKGVHLGKHFVYLGDDIGPIDHQAGALGRTQRGVQHGTVLGDIDVFPGGKHGVPAVRQAHLVCKINKGTQHIGVDQVLGEVDVEFASCEGERFRPRRIGGEPAAQIRLQRVVEGLQPCPGRGRRRIRQAGSLRFPLVVRLVPGHTTEPGSLTSITCAAGKAAAGGSIACVTARPQQTAERSELFLTRTCTSRPRPTACRGGCLRLRRRGHCSATLGYFPEYLHGRGAQLRLWKSESDGSRGTKANCGCCLWPREGVRTISHACSTPG